MSAVDGGAGSRGIPKRKMKRTGSLGGNITIRIKEPGVRKTQSFSVRSSKGSPPQIQRSASSSMSRTRSSQQPAAFKAVMSVVWRTEKFPTFNKIADSLKKNGGWEGEINEQVSKLSNEDLKKLIDVEPVDLRGYDREVLMVVFASAQTQMKSKRILDSDASAKFTNIIPNLTVDVHSVDEKKMKYLGGGAVNQVFKVEIKGENYVFKPDPSELDAITLMKEQHFGTAAASGIPPGIDAHLSSRAVASSKVDALLYGDKTISVKTEFVVINGQRGILMKMASGRSPKTRGVEKVQVDIKKHPKVVIAMNRRISKNGKLSEKDLKMFAAALNYRRLELGKNDKGKTILIGTRAELKNLNPDNPVTAEGLIRLQVKDIITGECDRHPENYFVDDDGKVTGIDEDCCFGVDAIPEGVDVRSQPSIKFLVPNNASLMLRMPPVITKGVKDDIERLHSVKGKDNLIKTLKPYISEAEIKAALARLDKLHKHIESPYCKVVKTKEKLLSSDARVLMDSNNSYWGREVMVYDSDQSGWNYLREHRS